MRADLSRQAENWIPFGNGTDLLLGNVYIFGFADLSRKEHSAENQRQDQKYYR